MNNYKPYTQRIQTVFSSINSLIGAHPWFRCSYKILSGSPGEESIRLGHTHVYSTLPTLTSWTNLRLFTAGRHDTSRMAQIGLGINPFNGLIQTFTLWLMRLPGQKLFFGHGHVNMHILQDGRAKEKSPK